MEVQSNASCNEVQEQIMEVQSNGLVIIRGFAKAKPLFHYFAESQ